MKHEMVSCNCLKDNCDYLLITINQDNKEIVETSCNKIQLLANMDQCLDSGYKLAKVYRRIDD